MLDTDAAFGTDAGGFWWDVAVPQVSVRPEVDAAQAAYATARQKQRTAS